MDKNKKVQIKESLQFGWKKLKENTGLLVSVVAIIMIVAIGSSIITEISKEDFRITSAIFNLLTIIISIVMGMGFIKITLDLVSNKKSKISDLFSQSDKFLNYIGATIIYNIVFVIGLILLIIPGIIWFVKYQFYSFEIIENNLRPIEALKRSGQITSGHKWDLFIFNIALGIINAIGVIIFGIGLFITIPVTGVALAYIFKKLSSSKN